MKNIQWEVSNKIYIENQRVLFGYLLENNITKIKVKVSKELFEFLSKNNVAIDNKNHLLSLETVSVNYKECLNEIESIIIENFTEEEKQEFRDLFIEYKKSKLDYKKLWEIIKNDMHYLGDSSLSGNEILEKIKILEQEMLDGIEIESGHYLIMSNFMNEPIGCCSTDGILSVMCEESDITFQRSNKKKCPICKGGMN